jgi:FMN reductase
MSATTTATVVVGNPKANSRTRTVGEAVARRVLAAAGLDAVEPHVVELSALGPSLFDWSAAPVKAEVERLSASRLAVIATPVYKATYTGLLKSFLDWFGQTGLAGVTAVPVMVGAAPHHALAVELHLRPLLVEIGATVPSRGLFVIEDQFDSLETAIDAWLTTAAPYLVASLTAGA